MCIPVKKMAIRLASVGRWTATMVLYDFVPTSHRLILEPMRILLLRHAKSSWDQPGLPDHDRPLAPRGERAAPAMGAHLAETDLRIDRIISSTAVRALSTARLFREAFNQSIPLTTRRDLYHADPDSILAIALEEAGGNPEARILLVGHNPGMHELAVQLCSEGEPDQIDRLQAKFPTGALAEFDLPDWGGENELTAVPSAVRLVRYTRPKDLPGARSQGL